jgi:pimeloyl-ACP methyl ester carboxylesterase
MTLQDAHSGPIRYRTRPGAGPVVVCLHGIGSDASSFDPLVPHLPADWQLIAWHAPGYGGSAPLATDWPVAGDYAAALAGLLDRLGIARAMVVGHSLGTLMGAAFAAAQPDRVAALALLAPAQGYGVAPGGELPANAQARIDDLQRLGAPGFAAARAGNLLHRPEDHPAARAQIAAAMARVSLPGYAQAVRMLASGDLAADCARLATPTALLVGTEDRITPPDQARRAHAALPEAARGALHLLPGLGHALHQQDPAAAAALLVPFVQECCHVHR